MTKVHTIFKELLLGPRTRQELRALTGFGYAEISSAVATIRKHGNSLKYNPLTHQYTLVSNGTTPTFKYGSLKKPCKSLSPIVQDLFRTMDEEGIDIPPIAEKAGITYHTMANWKQGRHEPRIIDLEIVAEILGLRLVLTKEPAR